MKCAACGYDTPDFIWPLIYLVINQVELYACPECGTVRVEEEK